MLVRSARPPTQPDATLDDAGDVVLRNGAVHLYRADGLDPVRISTRWLASVAAPEIDACCDTPDRRCWSDGSNDARRRPVDGLDRIAAADVTPDRRTLVVRWIGDHVQHVALDEIRRAVAATDDGVPAPRPWTATTTVRRRGVDACLTDDDALGSVLRDVMIDGAVVLTGAGDADPDLGGRIVDRLSSPFTTHVGAVFGLVPAKLPAHLGETTGPIELHTDMAYRQVPPSLQVLHCITPAADGGQTLLADVHTAAERLSVAARLTLMTTRVLFAATSQDVDLRGHHRILTFERDRLTTVFNGRKVLLGPADADDVWAAVAELTAVLDTPSLGVEVPLAAGEVLVFDNTRILHGRAGFTDRRRHLVGWYGHLEDAASRLRVLAGKAA